jgi:hypothetical protein
MYIETIREKDLGITLRDIVYGQCFSFVANKEKIFIRGCIFGNGCRIETYTLLETGLVTETRNLEQYVEPRNIKGIEIPQ